MRFFSLIDFARFCFIVVDFGLLFAFSEIYISVFWVFGYLCFALAFAKCSIAHYFVISFLDVLSVF